MYTANFKGIWWKHNLSDNNMQLQSALSCTVLQTICICNESEENEKMSANSWFLSYIFFFQWTQVQTCNEILYTVLIQKQRNCICVRFFFKWKPRNYLTCKIYLILIFELSQHRRKLEASREVISTESSLATHWY